MRMKDHFHLKFGETTVTGEFRSDSFWIIEGTTKNSKKEACKDQENNDIRIKFELSGI